MQLAVFTLLSIEDNNTGCRTILNEGNFYFKITFLYGTPV